MKSGSVNRTSVFFFLLPVFLKIEVVDVLNFGLLSLTGNEEVKLLVSIFSIFNFLAACDAYKPFSLQIKGFLLN